MNFQKSKKAYLQASKVLVGGVNSPVRAFGSVGGHPLFFERGKGSKLIDIDGNEYVDFVNSWGALLFGHAPDFLTQTLERSMKKGTSFGAPTEQETTLAEKIRDAMPSMQKVRFVNSGTEATMSAVRLARGTTGRERIVKFEGCYHGHGDSFLIKAGSGALTLGAPSGPGIPRGTAEATLMATYNDLDSLRFLFDAHGTDIAAIIVEPVAGNMGLVLPRKGFLEGLRELADAYGAKLVFDEVISGFRLTQGGAQSYFHVEPDLTCLGKVIGGGLPMAAYGGKEEIMAHLSPQGKVYQAGTLSGNPLAVAAGLAMLEEIERTPQLYERLNRLGVILKQGLENNFSKAGVSATVQQLGSMLCVFFTQTKEVSYYRDVMSTDVEFYKSYFHAHLKRGIYLPPSAYETFFISAAHSEQDLAHFLEVNQAALKELTS